MEMLSLPALVAWREMEASCIIPSPHLTRTAQTIMQNNQASFIQVATFLAAHFGKVVFFGTVHMVGNFNISSIDLHCY